MAMTRARLICPFKIPEYTWSDGRKDAEKEACVFPFSIGSDPIDTLYIGGNEWEWELALFDALILVANAIHQDARL